MDDKQKKQLMIGGGVAGGLVALALLYFFVLKGPSDETTDTTTQANPQKAGEGMGRPRPTPQSAGAGGAPQQAASANPAPAGKNKSLQIASAFPGRKTDPFYYERHIVPPPPNVFDQVTPKMVAVENAPRKSTIHTTVRVVPTRRVSGLMSGDGVYAILENTNGDTEIVKPGSRTKDGYTVVAINPDSVVLELEDPATHTTYVQTVMFSDASVSSTPNGGRGGNGGPGGGPPGAPPGGPVDTSGG